MPRTIASQPRFALRASARALIRIAALLLPLTAFSASGDASQPPGERSAAAPAAPVTDWNTTFVNNAGPSGTVGAFAVWDDGSGEALYAGANNNSSTGGFTTAGGIATQWIGRWNGVSWSALGSGLNGPVTSMVAFGNELVVSGLFTEAGGIPVNGIARWNGHRWAGLEGNVSSVSALIVFGGELIAAAGFGVARWTGSGWIAVGDSLGQPVSALVDYNGVLVAGGNFRTFDANPIRYVAQWTGTQWAPIGGGLNNWVTELTVHQGDLVAAGLINVGVRRWNGTAWSAVGNLTRIEALTSHNGELIAGTLGSRGGLVRFDGSAWVPLAGGTDSLVYGLLSHAGQLYAGGTFGRAGTVAANRVARWDGSTWATLGSGLDGAVLDYVELDGDLVMAGRFRGAGGVLTRGIARWNGSAWSGLDGGLGGEVYAVAVFNNQLVAAGPNFDDPNGILTSRVMRWDGNGWSPLGTGMQGDVNDLIVFNGELIAAGSFSNAGGVAVNSIARWTGSGWAPMGTAELSQILVMTIYANQLVVAGHSVAPSGAPAFAIERWNGQNWEPLGAQPNYRIHSLAVRNGELFAGGTLDGAGGNVDSVIRWDGLAWTGLPGLDHSVNALAVHNGDLVAAGSYPSGADIHISRWNGSTWSALGAAVDRGVASLHVYQGTLLAGGNFHRVGNMVSPFIAAYGPAQTTEANIVATSPSPSQPGESVQISVLVTGVTAPTVVHVTITGSPGGSCTDLVLDPLDATTSVAQCTIQWNTACPRRVLANYIGGTDGLTTWQSSVSAAVTHVVAGGVGCALPDLFGDGFE